MERAQDLCTRLDWLFRGKLKLLGSWDYKIDFLFLVSVFWVMETNPTTSLISLLSCDLCLSFPFGVWWPINFKVSFPSRLWPTVYTFEWQPTACASQFDIFTTVPTSSEKWYRFSIIQRFPLQRFRDIAVLVVDSRGYKMA